MYTFIVSPRAVVLAAVAMMIIGALWYSPLLFGKKWQALMGADMKILAPDAKAKVRAYGGSTLVAVVSSYILAVFLKNLFIPSPKEALLVAFCAWLGFTATAYFNDVSYNPLRTPLQLYAITAGFYLVSFLIQALIIFIVSPL